VISNKKKNKSKIAASLCSQWQTAKSSIAHYHWKKGDTLYFSPCTWCGNIKEELSLQTSAGSAAIPWFDEIAHFGKSRIGNFF